MKKLSILFIIIGVLLAACAQKEQHETDIPIEKSNTETKMKHLDLKGEKELAVFTKAVSDSVEEAGIVNMENPQYTFSLGEESYSLWITKDSGTIMNTKQTQTIYSLSKDSIKEVNEYLND